MTQGIEGARRLMETSDPDTVNQYLRFGWKLINQYRLEATSDAPARMKYVLAAVIRTLEETKEILILHDASSANEHLDLGWVLIEKFVTAAADGPRHESVHFVVAWQSEGRPVKPGGAVGAVDCRVGRQIGGRNRAGKALRRSADLDIMAGTIAPPTHRTPHSGIPSHACSLPPRPADDRSGWHRRHGAGLDGRRGRARPAGFRYCLNTATLRGFKLPIAEVVEIAARRTLRRS